MGRMLENPKRNVLSFRVADPELNQILDHADPGETTADLVHGLVMDGIRFRAEQPATGEGDDQPR